MGGCGWFFGGGCGYRVVGAVVWGDEADEAGEASPLGAEDVAEAVHGEGIVAVVGFGLLGEYAAQVAAAQSGLDLVGGGAEFAAGLAGG